jgi:FKBP-type peptidyl-prolyl cis-trans isomerase FkpA
MKRLAATAMLLVVSCATRPPAAAPTPKSTGPLTNDEQKSLYALGYMMGSSLKPFSLTPSELDVVTEGALDSVTGAQARVELNAYRPKVQAMAMARGKALADIQKQKDAPLLAKAAAEPGAERLPSGVIVQHLVPGTGDSPTATDVVKVDYEGKLLGDGTVFDSSIQRGQPATFSLRTVVKCWSEGLQKLKVGEKAKLTCPSDACYGDAGHPPKIPGGSALTFEVTLREITKGLATPPVASSVGKPGAVTSAVRTSSSGAGKTQQASVASGAHIGTAGRARVAHPAPKS